MPLWAAIALAAGSGPVMDFAFPDTNVWPAIIPGLAMALIALIGRRGASAYLIGFISGLSFFLVHIPWIMKFLGSFPPPLNSVPLIALSTFEAIFWGFAAILITLAYRWVPRAFPGVAGRLILLPAVISGIWVLREAITSTWPWGGFSWGRLAFSQSESPFASLLSWIGAAGVSFVIAFIVSSAIEAFRIATRETWIRTASIVVAAATLALVVPAWHTTTDGTMSVAAVQGNGKAGYFDARQNGDLLTSQYDATRAIPEDADVDVIVWPEGGSDIDPTSVPYAADLFNDITTRYDAALVSGTITERGVETFNSSILWKTGEGAIDIYDKRHPVPFGEYVPAREFFVPLAPELLALIGRDYTPGTTDAVFDINGVITGINICFDIVDDALMHETVDEGAQIVFAQSNNADFGRTDESVQQLAIARVRAMELGRSVVVNSTVGTSAIILPDGSTLDQLEWFTADYMLADVPLATDVTPAFVIGQQLVWFLSGLALATMILARIAIGRTKKRR